MFGRGSFSLFHNGRSRLEGVSDENHPAAVQPQEHKTARASLQTRAVNGAETFYVVKTLRLAQVPFSEKLRLSSWERLDRMVIRTSSLEANVHMHC